MIENKPTNKDRIIGLCGAKVNIGCQGTQPLRKTCESCNLLDEAMETDYYPKTLKEMIDQSSPIRCKKQPQIKAIFCGV